VHLAEVESGVFVVGVVQGARVVGEAVGLPGEAEVDVVFVGVGVIGVVGHVGYPGAGVQTAFAGGFHAALESAFVDGLGQSSPHVVVGDAGAAFQVSEPWGGSHQGQR